MTARGATAIVGGLAVALLLTQAVRSVSQWSAGPADVHAYQIAADKIARGVDPYASDDPESGLRYLYPPTFVLAFSPILRIAGPTGFATWSALQVLLLGLLALCVYASPRGRDVDASQVGLAAVLLLFAPAWRNLVEGQASSLVIVWLLAGAILLEWGWLLAAGALIAFAAEVKVFPAIALVVLIAQGRSRAAAYVVVGAVVALLLSFAAAWFTGGLPGGPPALLELWWSWVRNMVQPVASDPSSWVVSEFTPWNHSFIATLHRLFDPEVSAIHGMGEPLVSLSREVLRMAGWALGGAGMALGVWLAHRGRALPEVRVASFGLVLLMVNLLHVQTWTHHLLTFALCAPLFGSTCDATRNTRPFAWASVALFAMLFALPSALAIVLPAGAGLRLYALSYEAGRAGIATLVVLLVWISAFTLAVRQTDRSTRHAERHDAWRGSTDSEPEDRGAVAAERGVDSPAASSPARPAACPPRSRG